MDHFEETVASEAIYHGRILDLYRDDVRLENGERASREWVHHSGGVSVLALTENEEVYVVRQFRYPYHRMLLEIPAGKLKSRRRSPDLRQARTGGRMRADCQPLREPRLIVTRRWLIPMR